MHGFCTSNKSIVSQMQIGIGSLHYSAHVRSLANCALDSVHTYMCMYLYKTRSTPVHTCSNTCTHARTHTYMHAHTHLYIYIYIYIYYVCGSSAWKFRRGGHIRNGSEVFAVSRRSSLAQTRHGCVSRLQARLRVRGGRQGHVSDPPEPKDAPGDVSSRSVWFLLRRSNSHGHIQLVFEIRNGSSLSSRCATTTATSRFRLETLGNLSMLTAKACLVSVESFVVRVPLLRDRSSAPGVALNMVYASSVLGRQKETNTTQHIKMNKYKYKYEYNNKQICIHIHTRRKRY